MVCGGGQGIVSGGELAVPKPNPVPVFVPDGEELAHREEHGPLQPSRPALGGYVEGAHGVHVPVPELYAHRVVHAGGKHVQDAAPQGELAHPLHLLAPGIAQGGQPVRQLVRVIAAGGVHLHHMGGQRPGGEGALEQPLHRGGDEPGPALGHGVEGGKALVLPLAGGHRAVVEQKFPRPHHDGGYARQRRHVGAQPGALPLVGAHQYHGTVQPLQKARREVGPVDGGQPRHLHRGAARFQIRRQPGELGHRIQDVQKLFHGNLN